MAVTLARTIYINSKVKLAAENATVGNNNIPNHNPAAASGALFMTTQSANFSLNIPRQDVNAFGFDGVLDRPQLEAETATFETSWIPQTRCSDDFTLGLDIDGLMLNDMILEAKAQTPDYVLIGGNGVGGVKHALMNSLTGEASVGALASMSGTWTGATFDVANPQFVGFTDVAGGAVGADWSDPPPNNDPGSGVGTHPFNVGGAFRFWGGLLTTPKDVSLFTTASGLLATPGPAGTAHIAGGVAGTAAAGLLDEDIEPAALEGDSTQGVAGATNDNVIESCAQSASFSWDIPVEIILCLGADPATDGLALGNPPGTSSMTVEALSAQLSSDIVARSYSLLIGTYHMGLLSGNVDSRTHNLAVGDLYGTYNYVIGGTGDGFEIGPTSKTLLLRTSPSDPEAHAACP